MTPPKRKKPQGLDALLDAAALPERTVEVCLRGDLVAEFEDLERELRDARTERTTLADAGRPALIAEKIEKVREQMQDSTIVFRFRGLPRKGSAEKPGWSDLVDANPPRKDNEDDRGVGYNVETFFPSLIRACLVEPDVSDEQWVKLDATLSSRQYDDLVETAVAVCRRKVDVPFSFAASAALRTYEPESQQPSD